MRAREQRQPDGVGILLHDRLGHLLGRLVQPGVDDLEAGVAQRAGDHLGAPVVAVEAGLGDDDSVSATHEVAILGGCPRTPSRRRGTPTSRAATRSRGRATRRPQRKSVVTGRTRHYAFIEGRFDVLGGSMGAAHGEKVVRAYRRAIDERLPMVVLSASGGARMQEGMVSLIQMARTAAAARDHAASGRLVAWPSTAARPREECSRRTRRSSTSRRRGPARSSGSPGPASSSSPPARGCRRTRTPPSPPTAHGLVDALVAAGRGGRVDRRRAGPRRLDAPPAPRRRPRRARRGSTPRRSHGARCSGRVSRHRFTGRQWADRLCAAVGRAARHRPRRCHAALATLAGRRGRRDRGRPARAATAGTGPRATGSPGAPSPSPVGSDLPLLTFVDTPGADPGAASEADGIAREIAVTFAAMDALSTPSVSVCVGEGGSGGALALAYADRLLMLEHAVFSVIAPEGAAAILERDASKAPELAARLRLTSADLLDLGIVDERRAPKTPSRSAPRSSPPSTPPAPATAAAASTTPRPDGSGEAQHRACRDRHRRRARGRAPRRPGARAVELGRRQEPPRRPGIRRRQCRGLRPPGRRATGAAARARRLPTRHPREPPRRRRVARLRGQPAGQGPALPGAVAQGDARLSCAVHGVDLPARRLRAEAVLGDGEHRRPAHHRPAHRGDDHHDHDN